MKEQENRAGNCDVDSGSVPVKRQKLDSDFPVLHKLSTPGAKGNLSLKQRGKTSSVELVNELKLLHQMLVKQTEGNASNKFEFVFKAVENPVISKSTDSLVKSISACIVVNLLRCCKKSAQLTDVALEKMLRFLIEELRRLGDINAASFSWSFYLLESLAINSQLVLLFKLAPEICDQLLLLVFGALLDVVRDDHSAAVLEHSRTVLERLINASLYLSEDMMELLLERFAVSYGCQASKKIIQQLFSSCAGKLDQFIAQYVGKLIEGSQNKHRELERIFANIFKLFSQVPECTVSLWSLLVEECQNLNEHRRRQATDCVSKMFSFAREGQLLLHRAPYLWSAWIERAHDKSNSIKSIWSANLPAILQSLPSTINDATLLKAIACLLNDSDEKIRESMLLQLKQLESVPDALIDPVFNRCHDTKVNVRTIALSCCQKMHWKSEVICKNSFNLMYTKDRECKNQFEEYLEQSLLGTLSDESKLLWVFRHVGEAELDAFNSFVASKASVYKMLDYLISVARQSKSCTKESMIEKLVQICNAYHSKFSSISKETLVKCMNLFVNDLNNFGVNSLEYLLTVRIDNFETSESAAKQIEYPVFIKRISWQLLNSQFVLLLATNCGSHSNIPTVLQILIHNIPLLGNVCLNHLVGQFLESQNQCLLKSIKYILSNNSKLEMEKKNGLLSLLKQKYPKLIEVHDSPDMKSIEVLFLLDDKLANDYLSELNLTQKSCWKILAAISKASPHHLQRYLKDILMAVKNNIDSIQIEDAILILKMFVYISKDIKMASIFSLLQSLAVSLVQATKKDKQTLQTNAANEKSDKVAPSIENELMIDELNTSKLYYTYGRLLSNSPTKPFLLSDFISIVQHEDCSIRQEFISLLGKGIYSGKLNRTFICLLFLTAVEPSIAVQTRTKSLIKSIGTAFPFQLTNLFEHFLLLLSCHPDFQANYQHPEIQLLFVKFIKYFTDFAVTEQTISDAYLTAVKLKQCKFADSVIQSRNKVLHSICDVATETILSIAHSNKWTIESIPTKEFAPLEYQQCGILQQLIESDSI